MNILIIGDSFSADWSVKYNRYPGWPTLLAKDHNVTNLAQAGVSEYKILKQLQSIDIGLFDHIIISHTSPYRIFVREHPVHALDELHSNADMVYSDIKHHNSKLRNTFNKVLKAGVICFEKIFTSEYLNEIHRLIRNEIRSEVIFCDVIELGFFDENLGTRTAIDLTDFRVKHMGIINHLSARGNELLAEMIQDNINLPK